MTHGERIQTMIMDIVNESQGKNEILMSPTIQKATDALRAFLFEQVYRDKWRKKEEDKCHLVIRNLFEHFSHHPDEMPMEYIQTVYSEGIERGVTDFLACMTDRYALRLYSELFLPTGFPLH